MKLKVELAILTLFHWLYTLLLDLKQSTIVPITEKDDYIYIYTNRNDATRNYIYI